MPEGSPTESYLEVDAEGEDGTGPATAAVLESVAEVLRDAPDTYRCNFELTIEEQVNGGYDVQEDPDNLTEPETGVYF